MNNVLLYTLVCIACYTQCYQSTLNTLYPCGKPWHHVSFDVAMKKITHLKQIAVTEHILKIDGYDIYLCFKKLYDQFNLTMIQATDTLKIPKIIHQIWLGSPVPDVYKELMQTWIDFHTAREWEYKLWTDDNVHTIFPLYNQKYYDETDNFGTKSDIVRWELLYKFGGLYVDVDYECLRPFDIFHYTYDFYTGIQPLDTHFVQLGAALVGSQPGHPILKHCIETIKDDWREKGAPKKTGPVHFTRSFYAMAGHNGSIDIALPPYYVYPLGAQEKVSREQYDIWVEQGSFAVHWWSKSWMPKEYRPSMFKALGNDASTVNWNA